MKFGPFYNLNLDQIFEKSGFLIMKILMNTGLNDYKVERNLNSVFQLLSGLIGFLKIYFTY